MSDPAVHAPGRIVWHELMSDNVEKSVDFYTSLFGWEVDNVVMGDGEYRMIRNGTESIGGFMQQADGDPSPPHWIAYANVPDIRRSVEAAIRAGGEAPVPGMDVPGIGRFAVIRDPQGGLICSWQGETDDPPEREGPPPQGVFCWDELVTTDPEASKSFYSGVFGWQPAPMDPSQPEKYTFFMRGADKCDAAMMPIPAEVEDPATAWIAYVAVDDIDEMAAKASSLGALICIPPTAIPDFGRFSVFRDPLGANFAMWQPAAQ